MLTRSGDIRDKKSKVVKIRAEFWTIFCRHKFLGTGLVKIVPRYHPCLAGRRLKTFREDSSLSPEVIDSEMSNFRPDF